MAPLRLGPDLPVPACPVRMASDAGVSQLGTIGDLIAGGMSGPSYPYSGGYMEQPAVLMDAAGVYQSAKREQEAADGPPAGGR